MNLLLGQFIIFSVNKLFGISQGQFVNLGNQIGCCGIGIDIFIIVYYFGLYKFGMKQVYGNVIGFEIIGQRNVCGIKCCFVYLIVVVVVGIIISY